jgi:uncharacterized FAD-dependent dehydrogenase
MSQLITLKLPPEIAYDESALERELAKVTGIESPKFRLARRSVDARSRKQIWVNLSVDLLASDEPIVLNYDRQYPNVSQKDCVIIIGAGPAGMFAAMRLIELGMKPIIIERGSDVRARRRDLAAINKDQIVNPESNYCFGEGGAGTYSDGKLYTRSKKRGDIHSTWCHHRDSS